MNIVDIPGLDGSNPLHALAAYGLLALTDDLGPDAAMGWVRVGGRYSPRIAIGLSKDDWLKGVSDALRQAGAVATVEGGSKAEQRAVADLRSQKNRLVKGLKETSAGARAEGRATRLTPSASKALVSERMAPIKAELKEVEHRLGEAELALSNVLGWGPAHLGDVIGVTPEVFRLHARRALDAAEGNASIVRQLAGLGSDGCLDNGKLIATPFSFSNGASGKCLLKDFRTLSTRCSLEQVRDALLVGTGETDDVTSLNWDPRDQRNFAHQWNDPAASVARTAVVANALAYLGMGLLCAFPGVRGLSAVALVERGFEWPIWSPLLGAPVVSALLAHRSRNETAVQRAARGVLEVFRSDRVNPTGKRNFFAPSRAV